MALRVHGLRYPEGDDGQSCPSCGRANDEDVRFCSACGAEMASAGGPPRKGLSPAPLIVIIVLVVAAVVAAAFLVFFMRTDAGTGGDVTTPTPVASAPPTASPTPVESFYLAAVTGPHANGLSTVEPDGTVRQITEKVGAQAFQLAWSQDGQRLACVAGAWNRRSLWVADLAAGEIEKVEFTTPAIVSVDSVAWLNRSQILVAGFTTAPKNRGEVGELVQFDPAMNDGVTQPLEDADGVALRGVSVSASQDGTKIAFVTYTDQQVDQYGMATATEKLELVDWQSGEVTELGSNQAEFEVNARSFDEPLIAPTATPSSSGLRAATWAPGYTVIDANGTTLMPAKEALCTRQAMRGIPRGRRWCSPDTRPTGRAAGGPDDLLRVRQSCRRDHRRRSRASRGPPCKSLSWSPDGETIAFAEWDRDTYCDRRHL